jgi:hypothetical protein
LGNVRLLSRSSEREVRDYIHHYVDERGDTDTATCFLAMMAAGDSGSQGVFVADPDAVRNLVATGPTLRSPALRNRSPRSSSRYLRPA